MLTEWIVLLEAVRNKSSLEVDKETLYRLLKAVRPAMPVALHSDDRYAVQLQVAAGDPHEAVGMALAVWSDALKTGGVAPWELARAEEMTSAELDYELALSQAADGLTGVLADEPRHAASDGFSGLEHGPLAGCISTCNSRWRLMLQRSGDVLTVLSADGNVLFSFAPDGVNPLVVEGAAGSTFPGRVHPDDADIVEDALAAVVASPGEPAVFLARFVANDDWRWFESVATNLRDEPLVGALVINSRDVTDRKRLEERLAEMAVHDSLTGLLNRTIFLDELDSLWPARPPGRTPRCSLSTSTTFEGSSIATGPRQVTSCW